MVEYEDWGSARIAQLEQEDLERYQRDVLRSSRYSYDDETPNYADEFHSKLSVLIDLVRGLSSDIKRTTSSIENGPELPVMDLQPLSFVDDVASCNYSEMESETTNEQLSDEELMVNELPDFVEMMDISGVQGTDSSNSEVMTDLEVYKVSDSAINSYSLVNPSHQKQLTSMDSGFKVLSIYCAHMAPKWNNILETRPKQSNDMSVEVYYDHFFNWKRKLEDVNYIGGEESYVDDFIYGLEIKLGMRVCGYKWKPHTLYGAFRRAVIEESLMKNDAVMVFEEMPHPTSNNDQGTKDVLDVGGSVMLDAPLGSEFTIKPTGPNEGNVVNGGNGPAKAWLNGAGLIIEVVLSANAMKIYASIMVDVIPPTFRANVNEKLMDNYTRGINSNQPTLFDPVLEGAMVYPRDDIHVGLPIQRILFEISGRPLLFIEHQFYALLGSNIFYCHNAVLQKIAHKHIIILSTSRFKPSQDWARQSRNIEPVIVGPNFGKFHCSMHASGTNMVRQHAKFHTKERRDIEGVSNVMYLSKPGTFKLGFLLSDSKHFVQLVISNDNENATIGTLEDFIWDPGRCVISFYILEDKDFFKRVGKNILAMVKISSIKDEVFCQLKIWNSFAGLHIGMEVERYMLHVVIGDLLSPGTNAMCFAAISTPKMQGHTTTTANVLPFSIILVFQDPCYVPCCSILMLWLVGDLGYTMQ